MKTGLISLLLVAMAVGLLPSVAFAGKPGFYASADWINWKARRSDMDFVIVGPNIDWPNVGGDQINLNYDRNNGARIVLGYNLGTCWDVSMEYQTYNTGARQSVSKPANGRLWTTRLHPQSIVDEREATSVEARASLDYDVLDFTIRRQFMMDRGQRVTFGLFGGFRYAMIDQTLDINYVDSIHNDTSDVSNPIKLNGYGIRAGGQLDWNVCGGFSVFGRGAFSVLAARFNSRYTETEDNGSSTWNLVDISETYYQAVPVIETALGMSYRRGPWEVGCGYEMAIWGNVGGRRDFENDGDPSKFTNPSSDLILDGFFLRLCFNR